MHLVLSSTDNEPSEDPEGDTSLLLFEVGLDLKKKATSIENGKINLGAVPLEIPVLNKLEYVDLLSSSPLDTNLAKVERENFFEIQDFRENRISGNDNVEGLSADEYSSNVDELSAPEEFTDEELLFKEVGLSQKKLRLSLNSLARQESCNGNLTTALKVPRSKEQSVEELLVLIHYEWAIENSDVLTRMRKESIEFILDSELDQRLLDKGQFDLAVREFFEERHQQSRQNEGIKTQKIIEAVFLDKSCPIRIFRRFSFSLMQRWAASVNASTFGKSSTSAKPLLLKTTMLKGKAIQTYMLCPFSFHFLHWSTLVGLAESVASSSTFEVSVEDLIDKYSLYYTEFSSRFYYPKHQHYWLLLISDSGKGNNQLKKKTPANNKRTESGRIYKSTRDAEYLQRELIEAKEHPEELVKDWLVKVCPPCGLYVLFHMLFCR